MLSRNQYRNSCLINDFCRNASKEKPSDTTSPVSADNDQITVLTCATLHDTLRDRRIFNQETLQRNRGRDSVGQGDYCVVYLCCKRVGSLDVSRKTQWINLSDAKVRIGVDNVDRYHL